MGLEKNFSQEGGLILKSAFQPLPNSPDGTPNLKKYVEKWAKTYVENINKYVESMKEYPLLHKLWDSEKFRVVPPSFSFPLYLNSEN